MNVQCDCNDGCGGAANGSFKQLMNVMITNECSNSYSGNTFVASFDGNI